MVARRSCGVLVIGGGLAGVQAAEVASQFVADVLLVESGGIGRAPATTRDAATLAAYLAQDAGGVSDWKSSRVSLSRGMQALSANDPDALEEGRTPFQRGFYAYRQEIIDHGGNLSDPVLADFTAAGIYNRIGWLENYGLHLARTQEGLYRGFPSLGHSLERILLIEEAPRGVIEKIRKSAELFGATCAEGLYITKLFVEEGCIAGAYGLDVQTGKPVVLEARAVILAAGGADRLYRAEATGTAGDGYQLALEAGTALANMEFVAFGPEAKGGNGLPPGLFLVLLGLGAALQGEDGSPAVSNHHSTAHLARKLTDALQRGPVRLKIPADVQAMVAEMRSFGPYRTILERPIEVQVGCRGLLGGVVNRVFATEVQGLFVAGAVATGCHGADFLPGVETSFTLYSAENAAAAAATYYSVAKSGRVSEEAVASEEKRLAGLRDRPRKADKNQLEELEGQVRQIMGEGIGLRRTAQGLREAMAQLEDLESRVQELGASTGPDLVALCELHNLVATGELVCQAALLRTETRGQHVRADFPAVDEGQGLSWNAVVKRHGALEWRRVPVPQAATVPD